MTYLLLGVISFLVITAIGFYERQSNNPNRIQEKVQEEFLKIEFQSNEILAGENIKPEGDTSGSLWRRFLHRPGHTLPEGFTLLMWKGDSLVYWSNNSVPVLHVCQAVTRGVLKLKNGWYYLNSKQSGIFTIQLYFQLYHEFVFQNDFLKNGFSDRINVPGEVGLTIDAARYPIFAKGGKYAFSLIFNPPLKQAKGIENIVLFLGLIGLSGFFIFLFRILGSYTWLKERKGIYFIIFIAILILLRSIQQWYRFPTALYDGSLFGPEYHSTSMLLPTLGDFVINAMLLFIVGYLYYRSGTHLRGKQKEIYFEKVVNRLLFIATPVIFLTVLFYLLKTLIHNSSFALDFRNISDFSGASIWGTVVIGFLLLSALFIFQKILEATLSVHSNLTTGIVLLFILSVFATVVLNNANKTKEQEKRKLLAMKLAVRRNPVTEILYEKLDRKMRSDSILGNITRSDTLVKYLGEKYFKDYWNRYNIQVTVCTNGKRLKVQPQNYEIDCREYFARLKSGLGEATQVSNMYFIDYGTGRENYLAIVYPDSVHADVEGEIYIEFNSKSAYKDLGYPELLMDKRDAIELTHLTGYSYAFYKQGELVHAAGEHPFRMRIKMAGLGAGQGLFYRDDGMDHFYFPINKDSGVVISRSEDDFLDAITPFSYLFILLGFFLLLFHFLQYLANDRLLIPITLKDRLQVFIIGILVVSFLVVGVISVVNIVQLDAVKNTISLRERSVSVLVEMQHKFGNYDTLKERVGGELDNMLIKFANVFFTDINLYDPGGKIIGTSRPQIISEGLVSPWINSTAFDQLVVEKQSSVIQQESIGSLQYSSAYLPFYNDQEVLLGYLNLPYFSREDALKKEVSTFLITVVNIYVLLILSGIIIIFFISRYITSPLALLAEKLARLKFGGKNEKIDWKRSDEIGKLVEEYNRMVDELEKSAELLARSEREGAWREMARQVAHEIKNPLTPMKLSIQHLQKAWLEQAPDREERFKRFSQTLIEQIDTLSSIATEFSDFSKMEEPVHENVDLDSLLQSAVSLYRALGNITFVYFSEEQSAHVLADKKQLLRAFTNLFNNSVQAIGARLDGTVSVFLTQKGDFYLVEITDNGGGISEEQVLRIFQPNFTTKSGGMGLGLAIVKEILQSIGGRVTLLPAKVNETTFIVEIPKISVKDKNHER